MFLFLICIKPNPFTPIFAPSWICTLLKIKEFFIITNEPIIQLSPILTLLSIMLLLPIKEFFPILTFLPIKIFSPNFTFGYYFITSSDLDKFASGQSISALG